MEVIEGIGFDSKNLVLSNTEDVIRVNDLLENNTNFILEFHGEDDIKVSELIIATDIYSRIKNGEMKLSAIIGGK